MNSRPPEIAQDDSVEYLRGVLGHAIRSTLRALISSCRRLEELYSASHEVPTGTLLRVHADLRHTDRLLAVLASGAGAEEHDDLAPVAWSLSVARACVHAYTLRRFYDAGAHLKVGIDPNAHGEDAPLAPVALSREAASGAIRTILSLRSALEEALDASAINTESPGHFYDAFQRNAGLCLRILFQVDEWGLGTADTQRLRVWQGEAARSRDAEERERICSLVAGARGEALWRISLEPGPGVSTAAGALATQTGDALAAVAGPVLHPALDDGSWQPLANSDRELDRG